MLPTRIAQSIAQPYFYSREAVAGKLAFIRWLLVGDVGNCSVVASVRYFLTHSTRNVGFLMFLKRHVEIGVVKTSEEQFSQDFGSFPPVPLTCNKRSEKFKVLRSSKIRDSFYLIKFMVKIKESGCDGAVYGLDEEALFVLYGMQDIVGRAKEAFSDFISEYQKLNFFKKYFFPSC